MITTPTQQPDALRLADAWDAAISTRQHAAIGCEMADELRRLHAENEALKAVVSDAVDAEREACALICYKNWQSVSGDEIRARGTQ